MKDQQVFPQQLPDMSHAGDAPGITLFQHYAGLAMQGILASGRAPSALNTAENSINYANALIAELEKNS